MDHAPCEPAAHSGQGHRDAQARDDAPTPLAPGMGAVVTPHGVTFRVWAPHADEAWVKGDFNGWSVDAHPLRPEGQGFWALHVPQAEPGHGYTFRLRRGEMDVDRIDPQARQVTHSSGHGVVVDPEAFDWQGDDFSPPPRDRLVIYEMHVGSFHAPQEGRPGGFSDAIDRLDHVRRLGANAVQLMPVAEFAGDWSWGYNPAHVFAVESAYGGPEGLKAFVRAAHKLGLAVILDVVYNHFGPGDLHLWRFDGWHEGEGGGIYFYNDHRATTPWGATRPDYGRGEVRQFIRDNALMWLREYHLDGLRLDMTLYMRSITGGDDELPDGWSLMAWIADEVRAQHPQAILIAEDLRRDPRLTAPTAEGGAGFHAQWDAAFVHPVREAVQAVDDGARSMDALRDAILHRYGDDAFQRVIYSESHDEVANGRARVPHDIDAGDPDGWFARKRSTLAAALVFTAPGIPMLFQGQEFLEGGWFRDDVPLDWERRDTFGGILRLYRDLVRLRRGDGPTRGLCGPHANVFHVHDAMNVLAFHRWHAGGPGDDVVVLVNAAVDARPGHVLGLPRPGRWRVRLNSDARCYAGDFSGVGPTDVHADGEPRDGLPASAAVDLPPYAVLILSQDP